MSDARPRPESLFRSIESLAGHLDRALAGLSHDRRPESSGHRPQGHSNSSLLQHATTSETVDDKVHGSQQRRARRASLQHDGYAQSPLFDIRPSREALNPAYTLRRRNSSVLLATLLESLIKLSDWICSKRETHKLPSSR